MAYLRQKEYWHRKILNDHLVSYLVFWHTHPIKKVASSGKEVFKAIKANDETKDIPVFITSNSDVKELPDNVQPDKFIVKSGTTPTILAEIVKKQLGI